MWTEAQIKTAVEASARKVVAWAGEAQKVVQFIETNKTALAIEHHIPGGMKILEALGGTDKVLAIVVKDVPYVGEIFMAYDILHGLGAKPMEWGRPNDPEAEARLRERDSLTNG